MKRTAALALIVVLSIPPVCDVAGQIEAARAAPPVPAPGWVRKPAAECRYTAMGGTCYVRAQPYRTYAEYWRENGR